MDHRAININKEILESKLSALDPNFKPVANHKSSNLGKYILWGSFYAAIIFYLGILPMLVTDYLFEVNHPSIQDAASYVQAFNVLSFVWILGNVIAFILLFSLYMIIKLSIDDYRKNKATQS